MTLQKPNLNKPAFRVFPEAAENIKQDKCATCGKPVIAEDFRDQLSRKEYSISGMCQQCQDEVFGR